MVCVIAAGSKPCQTLPRLPLAQNATRPTGTAGREASAHGLRESYRELEPLLLRNRCLKMVATTEDTTCWSTCFSSGNTHGGLTAGHLSGFTFGHTTTSITSGNTHGFTPGHTYLGFSPLITPLA